MFLKLESETMCRELMEDVLKTFVTRDMERDGICKGKTAVGIGSNDRFTIRWTYEGQEEEQLTEAIASVFKHYSIDQFVMAFCGSIGDPPPDETTPVLMVEGCSDAAYPKIRQVSAIWSDDKQQIIAFHEMCADRLNDHDSLNLLRSTALPSQKALDHLRHKKEDRAKLILMGPGFLEH